MIRVTKGGQTMYIPKEYYKVVYKPHGWRPVNSDDSPPGTPEKSKRQSRDDLTAELDSLNTLEDIKGFAERHGINVEGITNRKQMKTEIAKAMNM